MVAVIPVSVTGKRAVKVVAGVTLQFSVCQQFSSGVGREFIISAAAAEKRLVFKAPLPVGACRDNL